MTDNQEHVDNKKQSHHEWSAGLYENSHAVFKEMMDKNAELFNHSLFDPFNMATTYMDAMFSLWQNPANAIAAQNQYFNESLKLWTYTANKMMGDEGEPVISPEVGDYRWRDEEWSDNIVFDYIKQSYLLAARCVADTVDAADGLDEKDAKKLAFFTKQITDALSPTNSPAINPAVLKATMEEKGENLVKGIQNFVRDMEKGEGKLQIAMTDRDAFTLGENVATTPGKIIFQNRMLQLIQYTPTTEKVYKTPLLIMPPWINKYYILDLQEKNSLIKWLVDQGHSVFVVSWVNPDESFAETDFDDYMADGIYPAIDAVLQATGEAKTNIVGYCVGGTLLAGSLAHMQASGDNRIKKATFFTALIDFDDPGDLEVFIDEAQLASLEKSMDEQGFLRGDQMSQSFNMLRSNDLIWSFYINNYLLGKEPAIFDLLYWNSDNTRLPAKMHSTYLRNMYMDNNLCKAGAMEFKGVPIDISTVDVPCYFISAIDDHIAPWRATYAGAKLFKGPVRFVLGGSGHIAGIVNPPYKEKYNYRTGPETLTDDADSWLEQSASHDGSWWPDWHDWLIIGGKTKVKARIPGTGALDVIEDAPGSYVKKRIS